MSSVLHKCSSDATRSRSVRRTRSGTVGSGSTEHPSEEQTNKRQTYGRGDKTVKRTANEPRKRTREKFTSPKTSAELAERGREGRTTGLTKRFVCGHEEQLKRTIEPRKRSFVPFLRPPPRRSLPKVRESKSNEWKTERRTDGRARTIGPMDGQTKERITGLFSISSSGLGVPLLRLRLPCSCVPPSFSISTVRSLGRLSQYLWQIGFEKSLRLRRKKNRTPTRRQTIKCRGQPRKPKLPRERSAIRAQVNTWTAPRHFDCGA